MPASKRKSLEKIARERRVAESYLQRVPLHEIAAAEHVHPSQITRDLAAIRAAWLTDAVADFDAARAQELARIDRLEGVYLVAWERSLTERQTRTAKKVKSEGSGTGRAAGGRDESSVKAENRDGDPRFLEGIQWCVEQRCRIWGFYAAANLNLKGPDLDAAIERELARVAAAGAGPAAGAPPAPGAASGGS